MSVGPIRIGALVLALALLGAGCPKKKEAGGAGAVTAADCEALRPKVESLYAGQEAPAEGEADLQAELVEANTHMVLKDCKRDPSRFVPCLDGADSVASIEADCVIPLDDEGKVEGRRFGGRGKAPRAPTDQ